MPISDDCRETWERMASLETEVKSLIKGQDRMLAKLDELANRKVACPMGENAHNEMLERVQCLKAEQQKLESRTDCLEQEAAAAKAQRRTLYLVMVVGISLAGLVWTIISWAFSKI